MPSRNTVILTMTVESLGALVISPADALARLESRFKDQLLIVAGDTQQVVRFAEELRLAITTTESAAVLDFVGTEALANITIDHVEEAINRLFPGRFIEP